MRYLYFLSFIIFLPITSTAQLYYDLSDEEQHELVVSLLYHHVKGSQKEKIYKINKNREPFGFEVSVIGDQANSFIEQYDSNLLVQLNSNKLFKNDIKDQEASLDFISFIEDHEPYGLNLGAEFVIDKCLRDGRKIEFLTSRANESKLNGSLFLKLKKKVFSNSFNIGSFNSFEIDGHAKFLLPERIISKYEISVTDVGRIVDFNNFKFEVISFKENRLVLKTVDPVVPYSLVAKESISKEYTSELIVPYDQNGFVLMPMSRSLSNYIPKKMWDIAESYKTIEALRAKLSLEDLSNWGKEKDYQYLVMEFDGARVFKIEYTQVQNAVWYKKVKGKWSKNKNGISGRLEKPKLY